MPAELWTHSGSIRISITYVIPKALTALLQTYTSWVKVRISLLFSAYSKRMTRAHATVFLHILIIAAVLHPESSSVIFYIGKLLGWSGSLLREEIKQFLCLDRVVP